MNIPGLVHVSELFRWEKRLILRFGLTSIGAALGAAGSIWLVGRFLGAANAGDPGRFGAAAHAFGLGDHGFLYAIAGLLIGSYVVTSMLAYDNRVTQQRIVKILELGMMERVIRHLLSLSIDFFDQQSHGDIIQAVRGDVSQLRMSVISLSNMVLGALQVIALVAVAVYLSPLLALVGLVFVPLVLFPILVIARKTLTASYRVRRTGYVLSDVVLQILTGARVIKAYRGEEAEAEHSVRRGAEYFDSLIGIVRVSALSRVALEAIAGVGMAAVIVVGGLGLRDGTLQWDALVPFLLAMRQLQGPLNNVNMHFVRLREYGAAVQRLGDLLATQPTVQDREGATALEGPVETIEVENLCFSHGESEVLRGLSFRVRRGETIGIVGPSGAGKSTLLNLLVRFYDPGEGCVKFDGVDLRALRLRDLYGQLAIVTQEPFLFSTTVAQNIRVGRPEATDAEVQAAARAAYVHDEILGLPDGYGTHVGIGGQPLSGGQRQRVNVARALLKNAPLLLLDEATSSLDSIAEAEVQRAIEGLLLGRTSFVVAHRLSTLRNADRILVLADGRQQGFASHEELLTSCSLYRELWETQHVGGSGRS